MKLPRYSVLLVTPLLSIAAPAFAQDAGAAPAASAAAPAASTAAPASSPPPASSAPASSAPATAAPAPAEGGDGAQKQDGFVFETHIYTQFFSLGAVVGTPLPLMTGGIFGGYKLDRLILGLGFDLTSYDAPGSGGAQITMRWAPGIRYDFVRSSDDRVALFGQADVSFGHDFGADVANELIGVDLGLGVRYWVHRQFAFAGVGGWNGDWRLTQSPDTSTVLQGIFAGVQVLGVF